MYWTLIAALAAVVALVVFGAPHLEAALMYHPDRGHVSPRAAGLDGVIERILSTADGERVITWYARAAPGQPTILYFHGNGGSLLTRAERIRKYAARGRGMLMMTYRGFGGSTGRPSERANVADALAAYDLLAGDGIKGEDIIVYGESLGSGVAVQVAAKRKVAGLILDAPYTSTVDVAEIFYPLLPSRLLMRDRYETLRHIGNVTAPLLVVHGARDEVIPVAMGRAVYAAAPGAKDIAILPEAGHADHYLYGSYDIIDAWIDRLRAGQRGADQSRRAG